VMPVMTTRGSSNHHARAMTVFMGEMLVAVSGGP